jgi:hypothetical protein
MKNHILSVPEWYRECTPRDQIRIIKDFLRKRGEPAWRKVPKVPHGAKWMTREGLLMLDVVLPGLRRGLANVEPCPGWQVTFTALWEKLNEISVPGSGEIACKTFLKGFSEWRLDRYDWASEPGIRWVRFQPNDYTAAQNVLEVRKDARDRECALATTTTLLAMLYWPGWVKLWNSKPDVDYQFPVLANVVDKHVSWGSSTVGLCTHGSHSKLHVSLRKLPEEASLYGRACPTIKIVTKS